MLPTGLKSFPQTQGGKAGRSKNKFMDRLKNNLVPQKLSIEIAENDPNLPI